PQPSAHAAAASDDRKPAPAGVRGESGLGAVGGGGRLVVLWMWAGHNDLLDLSPEQWGRPDLVSATVRNVSDALLGAVGALAGGLMRRGRTEEGRAAVLQTLSDRQPQDRAQAQARGQAQAQGRAQGPEPVRQPPPGKVHAEGGKGGEEGAEGAPFAKGPPKDLPTRVLVWSLSPIDLAPAVPPRLKPTVAAAVRSANERLRQGLGALYSSAGGALSSVQLYDMNEAVTAALQGRLGDLGMTTLEPCLRFEEEQQQSPTAPLRTGAARGAALATRSSLCAHPERHAFFDPVHPSAAAHERVLMRPFAQAQGWAL
ncbi:hypothetical protein HYH03_016045, partial [Edaphochlamys debaryana]